MMRRSLWLSMFAANVLVTMAPWMMQLPLRADPSWRPKGPTRREGNTYLTSGGYLT